MVFLQTGALLADSLAEAQRISTSTLARLSETLQKNSETEEGEWREGEMWIWKLLEAGSCGLKWSIQRERERDEATAHDCHGEFNI